MEVLGREVTVVDRTRVEDPYHAVLHDQRNPHQRAQVRSQEGIHHLYGGDVGDDDRFTFGGDPARKPSPHRHLHLVREDLLPAHRCTNVQGPTVLAHQQDRRRVGTQDLSNPLEEVAQQRVEPLIGEVEPHVRDPLEVAVESEHGLARE